MSREAAMREFTAFCENLDDQVYTKERVIGVKAYYRMIDTERARLERKYGVTGLGEECF